MHHAMEITVSGKHIEITDPIRDYAVEKAGKLSRYFDGLSRVEVVTDRRENHGFEVEMIAHVDRHQHLVASARSDDLYAGIDEVVDKLERQLTDHKEKLRNRKHNGAR